MGKGLHLSEKCCSVCKESYAEGVTDEFIKPPGLWMNTITPLQKLNPRRGVALI